MNIRIIQNKVLQIIKAGPRTHLELKKDLNDKCNVGLSELKISMNLLLKDKKLSCIRYGSTFLYMPYNESQEVAEKVLSQYRADLYQGVRK